MSSTYFELVALQDNLIQFIQKNYTAAESLPEWLWANIEDSIHPMVIAQTPIANLDHNIHKAQDFSITFTPRVRFEDGFYVTCLPNWKYIVQKQEYGLWCEVVDKLKWTQLTCSRLGYEAQSQIQVNFQLHPVLNSRENGWTLVEDTIIVKKISNIHF